jgi:hypothetical protein
MAADPTYPLYAGDFLVRMSLCSLDEIGAYQKIRCYLWVEKFIPKERLGLFLGLGWENAWKNISKYFSENENCEIFDPELEELREARLKFKEKQAINGCKGGRPILEETQNKPKHNPNITQNKPKHKPKHNPKKSHYEREIENEIEIENKEEKEKNGKKNNLIFPFESSEFLKLWETWKNYKKTEFNFNYKAIQSEQAALMEVYNLSGGDEPTANKIILQSMSNKWKGFFEIKNNNNANTTKTTETTGNNAFERANIAVNEYFGKQ